jgi:hypothetical protein
MERSRASQSWNRAAVGVVMDVFERYLRKAEEYARLAEQAHDPAVAHEYQELARQLRELAFQTQLHEPKPIGQ